MNYLGRNFEWLKSVTDETTLFNILYDPLLGVRNQIKNKEYKLRKMGYLQKRVICGLDLDLDRCRTLLIENNKGYPQQYTIRGPQIHFDNKNDALKYIIKQIYKNWVEL